MNIPDKAVTNTTPPAETSIPTMNHDTKPTDNATPQTAPIADRADAAFLQFAERILTVITIDGEGTAPPEEVKRLMAEVCPATIINSVGDN